MSNNLDLDQVAGNQNQKEVTGNDQAGQLDAAMTDVNTFLITATNIRTLTSEEFRRSRVFIIDEDGGSPATADIVLTVPAIKRGQFVIRNDTAFNVDVTISAQSKIVSRVAAGQQVTLECDGVDVVSRNVLGTFVQIRANVTSLFSLEGYENSNGGISFNFSKARGTFASPLIAVAADTIGIIRSKAYNGTVFQNITTIQSKVPAVSGSNVSGELRLRTADTSGVLQTRMQLYDSGIVEVFGQLKTTPTTVAGLPAAATVGAGSRSFVTDANATTFASIVAGGGANGVPVYSDNVNWRIG